MSDITKKYSFRLTSEDQDIYEFIELYKEKNIDYSETIRKLLKYAIVQINKEKEREQKENQYQEIKKELSLLKKQQEIYFNKIFDKLDNSVLIQGEISNDEINKEKEKVEKSIENSIDFMINSFGMFD